MILWIIIWIICGIPVILLPILAFVNYPYQGYPAPKWYIWVVGICLLIIVLSSVMVFSERQACKEFLYNYYDTTHLLQQIYAKASDIKSAEKQIQGRVVRLNNQFVYFITMNKKFGIFSPYQRDLRNISPIQLKYFDTTIVTDFSN